MTDLPAGYVNVPWERVRALRARVVRDGTPPAIADLDARIEAATRNAERLYVLFGRMPCQAAINEIVALKREKDDAWGRLAMAEPP